MAPTVILDKSALQCLSSREMLFLNKHYDLNVVPILISEVLGDLAKYKKDRNKSKNLVSQLAEKLQSGGSKISAHYRQIAISCLLGNEIPMDGRILMANATRLVDSEGKVGYFFDISQEAEAILRWHQGYFEKAEELGATIWREKTKSFDLEKYKKELNKIFEEKSSLSSFEELKIVLDNIFRGEIGHAIFLEEYINKLSVPPRIKELIIDRWMYQGFPPFYEFAPYAFFCMQVEFAFYTALLCGLVGTRSTNLLDLEYLYYLPFCHVFVSGDKFQVEFGKLFLRENQFLISREDLKKDLAIIIHHWDSLGEKEKEDYAYDYGSYPPQNLDTITKKIWDIHIKPWKPGSGNRALRMTQDQLNKIMEKLRPSLDAINKHRKKR